MVWQKAVKLVKYLYMVRETPDLAVNIETSNFKPQSWVQIPAPQKTRRKSWTTLTKIIIQPIGLSHTNNNI